ncbi:uncharacterized protein PSFLO_05745 [Pseudozyma flocculosa]|uniref:RING-type domain-containing protein n=1 Tax=Pseudozyma flocculosa TaxID=84751 RepID=A0A5C3F704_9BASI|nr:uncharacterized protein PSFLO_05745 [Pseudozyma flocculosa]
MASGSASHRHSLGTAADGAASQAAASPSAQGRNKRRLSPSPSRDDLQSDGEGSRSKRKRRLSWRSSLGISRSSRARTNADDDQLQPRSQDDPNDMQIDRDEGGSGTSQQRDQGTTIGEQHASSHAEASSSAHPSSSISSPAASQAAATCAESDNASAHASQHGAGEPSQSTADPFGDLWTSSRPTPGRPAEANAGRSSSTTAGAAPADEAQTEDPSGVRTPPPHLDVLREERDRARRSIEEALGRPPPSLGGPAGSQAAGPNSVNHPPPPPSTLSALLGDVLGIRPPGSTAASGASGGQPQASAAAASRSAGAPGPASHGQQQPGQPGQPGQAPAPTQAQAGPQAQPAAHNMMSGTSVIVQGALIARTLPSNRSRAQRAAARPSTTAGSAAEPVAAPRSNASAGSTSQLQDSRTSSDAARASASTTPGGAQGGQSTTSSTQRPRFLRRASEPSNPGLRMGAGGPGEEPQAATLEEQAAMLSRILGIATAATAASLVSPTSSHAADRALLQSTLQPAMESVDTRRRRPAGQLGASNNDGSDAAASSASSSSVGLGQGLRNRLMSLSNRARTLSTSTSSSSTSAPAAEPASLTESQRAAAELVNRLRRSSEAERGAAAPPPDASSSRSAGLASGLAMPVRRLTASLSSSSSSSSSSSTSTSSPSTAAGARGPAPSSGSAWSRLLRDTARHIMGSSRSERDDGAQAPNGSSASSSVGAADEASGRGRSDGAELPDGHSTGPNDIAGPLRLVREGLPVPQGEPGSFGNFLYHLLRDLTVAVQSIRPPGLEQDGEVRTTDYFERAYEAEPTNGAEVLDGEDDRSLNGAPAGREPPQTQTQTQTQPAQQGPHTPGDSATGSGAGASGAANGVDGNNDDEVRARRERDVQGGQLSFFRLFRFDPVAPSTLIPCVVVGVRSLGVTETLHGEAGIVPPGSGGAGGAGPMGRAPPTSTAGRPTTLGSDPEAGAAGGPNNAEDGDGQMPASRFLLFVSGGRYPENHPLLTANPSAAGRDLMILLELLGMMSAMQSKPTTVTQQEIDESGLRKLRSADIAALLKDGKVKENTAERCLVCLEDWTDDDDCRLLACQHVFHASCVDRWMTSSSNTCPMCRRQGVSKDGTSAGEETPESRTASAGGGGGGGAGFGATAESGGGDAEGAASQGAGTGAGPRPSM